MRKPRSNKSSARIREPQLKPRPQVRKKKSTAARSARPGVSPPTGRVQAYPPRSPFVSLQVPSHWWPYGGVTPQGGGDVTWSLAGVLQKPRGFLGAAFYSGPDGSFKKAPSVSYIYTFPGCVPVQSTPPLNAIEIYDIETGQSTLHSILEGPAFSGAVVVGLGPHIVPSKTLLGPLSSALVVGGEGWIDWDPAQQPYFSKQCWELALTAYGWGLNADMPQSQPFAAGAVGPDGRIYVMGGLQLPPVDNLNPVYYNTVQCLDLASGPKGTWSQLQPLNVPRVHAAAATAAGKIYIFGGINNGFALNSIEEYDPATGTWTLLTSEMPTPRYHHTAVTGSNGRIYVIGGMYACAAMDVVEEFDPVTKDWRWMTPMPTARYAHAAVATPDNRIFVLGGWRKVSENSVATGKIEVATLPTF